MDSAEQLRILEAAKSDPARLALATIDLAHSKLSVEERLSVKAALEAAALPHWIDETILRGLLSTSPDEAAQLMARLRNLNVVEPFPARGEGTVNVHEATRKALRQMIRREQPERFQLLSERARQFFTSKGAFHIRIEGVYHLFAADQDAAAIECARLDEEAAITFGPQAWLALATMLDELLAEKWLSGRALLEAVLSVHECRIARGDTTGVESAAQSALDLAKKVNDVRGAARAYGLLSFIRVSEGKLDLALEACRAALIHQERVCFENPANLDRQRELNSSHVQLGNVLLRQKRFEEALAAFRQSLVGSEALSLKDPRNAGWQREVGVAHSMLGDAYLKQRLLYDALVEFRKTETCYKSLVANDPNNADWQRELGVNQAKMGGLFFELEDSEAGLEAYGQAIATLKNIIARDSTNILWQRDLALAHANVGFGLAKSNRREEAIWNLRQAETIYQNAVTAGVSTAEWTADLEIIRGALIWLGHPDVESEHDGKSESSDPQRGG